MAAWSAHEVAISKGVEVDMPHGNNDFEVGRVIVFTTPCPLRLSQYSICDSAIRAEERLA